MSVAQTRNIDLDRALAEAERRFIESNPESARRHEVARANLPGGNTRSILFYSPFPLTIVRGEAQRVFDADGHSYLDFLGEYTAGLYGHSNPVIAEAITKALKSGIVLGGPNVYEARLAELLCERFPSLDRVRFCNSGTEANLNAFCAARAHTGRSHILVFEGAYHGGVFTFAHGGSPMNAPFPYVFARYNDLEGTRARIRENGERLAAIVIEPMMGAGGAIAARRDFLAMLREEASRHGIVLIFDEVMTSRLSAGGLQARLGIVPDMTSFGKYLGGGLTFGAFGGKAEIMERFDPRRPDYLPHSGTYNNNVLTMAAGVAGLTEVFTPDAAQALNARGDRLRERLNAAAEARGVAVQATGIGSILCLHLHGHPVETPEDNERSDPRARALFHLELLSRGFYTARRGFMSLSLPLTDADCDALAEAFEEVLALYRGLLSR